MTTTQQPTTEPSSTVCPQWCTHQAEVEGSASVVHQGIGTFFGDETYSRSECVG